MCNTLISTEVAKALNADKISLFRKLKKIQYKLKLDIKVSNVLAEQITRITKSYISILNVKFRT